MKKDLPDSNNFKNERGITYIKAIPQGFLCKLRFTGQQ